MHMHMPCAMYTQPATLALIPATIVVIHVRVCVCRAPPTLACGVSKSILPP